MDFLPTERRVLQRDGLHLFNIRYWSDELRRLMGQGEKVTIKYDPRDLSRVFVRVDDGYVETRPADVTRPAIALWEHRAAVAELREAGRRAVDEELIFSTILAQRALVDAAGAATKAARRASGPARPSCANRDDRRDAGGPGIRLRSAAAVALFRGGGMG